MAALSMRRVARELSVTPMALYWHFEDKDRLLDAMAETVVGSGEFDDLVGEAWDQRLRGVLSTLVELLREHPWIGPLLVERIVPQPNYLRALEIMLDSVREAGFGPQDGAVVIDQAVQAVVALTEHEPRAKPEASKQTSERLAMREYLENLAAEQFPNIRAAAGPLTGDLSIDKYYRLGIDTIVLGIDAVARRSERPVRASGRDDPDVGA